jgi:hypothetical protein
LVSSGGPVLTSSERSARAQAWKSWWDGLNSAAGRQFFRERTPSDEARSAVALLIADLADGSFRVREQATRSLPRYGSLAAAALEPLAEQGTPEEARRARQILTTIERSRDPAAVTAVLRRFVLRPPDNAVRLLLDYLPVADGEDVVTEVHAALAALAWRAAETPPELLAATTAREPVLRAAAAFALASRPDQQERVRALLADPNPLVRWRASEGLLRQGQREAVPVAIELIGKLPQAAEAERLVDLLRRLAGENAPETDQRSAWLAWWERTGERLELAPLGDLPRPIGVTQVVLMDPKQGTGRFVELGPDGRERARIEGLGYPVALAPAESGRVLIAEQQAGRVTERDRDGSIVWKAAVAQPLACERLPGGRTFVAGRQMLLEFDRRGEPVLSIRRPTPDIIGAARSRDGTFVIITSERRCLALDRTGKLLRSFPVGKVQPFCQIDLLPGGRVLVPEASHQRVTEYDASGQVVWQTSARQPVGAVRLAGGRTLIAGQAGGTVTEVDRSGKIVWQHEPGGLVWAACRR